MSSFADMAIGRRAPDEPAMRAPQLQSAVLAELGGVYLPVYTSQAAPCSELVLLVARAGVNPSKGAGMLLRRLLPFLVSLRRARQHSSEQRADFIPLGH